MKQNVDDPKDSMPESDPEPDEVLEKLEEMWDREVMKGDEDFFGRDLFKLEQKADRDADQQEQAKRGRRRRR